MSKLLPLKDKEQDWKDSPSSIPSTAKIWVRQLQLQEYRTYQLQEGNIHANPKLFLRLRRRITSFVTSKFSENQCYKDLKKKSFSRFFSRNCMYLYLLFEELLLK